MARNSRFDKRPQALAEARCIIPKRRMAGIPHYMNLRVSHARPVLIDDRWFDDRIASAMRKQHRLADFRQQIVVADRAREPRLADMGRGGVRVFRIHEA